MPTLPLSWDKIAEAAQDAAENPGTKAKALRDIIHNLIAAHEEEVERQVEAAVKEAEKQADDRTESAEDDARSYARAEFLDLLDKYGGHVECYLGLVTGRKLDAMCTCGWNDVQTDIERRTDK